MVKVKDQADGSNCNTQEPVRKQPPVPPVRGDLRMYTVNIKEGTDDAGNEPVFVGVNGSCYLVPRGVDSDVPESVVNVLREAVVTQEQELMEHGVKKIVVRNLPRYSFTAIPHPPSLASSMNGEGEKTSSRPYPPSPFMERGLGGEV